MLDNLLFGDVAVRSGGNIFIGVFGAVQTGKSTLIGNMLEKWIMPATDKDYSGELPARGEGKGVTTLSPKFCPAVPAEIASDAASARIKFCDTLGFPVDGAEGVEENGSQRLLSTPWSAEPLPFFQAALLCSENVAAQCTMGIVLTDCGLISGLPRQGVALAEKNAVSVLKKSGKPYIIVLNCSDPYSNETQSIKAELEKEYGASCVPLNCNELDIGGVEGIFRALLLEFPVTGLNVDIPEWMRFLPEDGSALSEIISKVKTYSKGVEKIKDCLSFDEILSDCKFWKSGSGVKLDLASGKANLLAEVKEGVFFDMLSEIAGEPLSDEFSLMRYVRGSSDAKRSYDKIKDAFECAKVNGYGIVQPSDEDMSLESPSVVRQGGSVGIKLRATAPSYHVVKIDVTGEVSPIMGAAAQSESIVQGMMNGFETRPEDMWDTNVFGKSLRGMVKEGLSGKVSSMPEEAKVKMRRAITKIINEGKGGIICILL